MFAINLSSALAKTTVLISFWLRLAILLVFYFGINPILIEKEIPRHRYSDSRDPNQTILEI